MKFTDIKDKSNTELQETLKELKVKLGKFRFELAHNTLKDFSQVNKTQKDIARIMTAMRNQK